jgi:threonine dehydratase
LVIEGAASVGLAVLLSGKIRLRDQKVVLVISGRNIDSNRFLSIIAQSGESNCFYKIDRSTQRLSTGRIP